MSGIVINDKFTASYIEVERTREKIFLQHHAVCIRIRIYVAIRIGITLE